MSLDYVNGDLLGELHPTLAPAIRDGAYTMSFVELITEAERLAKVLKNEGVGPGSAVPIQLPVSRQAVLCVLAILMTGAAFAPIDHRVPPLAAAKMAKMCGANTVISDKGNEVSGVAWMPIRDLLLKPSRPMVMESIVPPDTTYVIFTSGTSGDPKGVIVPVEGIASYLGWAMSEYELSAGWGAPLFTSLGFDLTITSLLGPLLRGRSVRILDPLRWPLQIAKDPNSVSGASFAKMTPSQVNLLCDLLEPDKTQIELPFLIVGGEAIYANSVRRWRESFPETAIVNEYGPSEATVGCCRAIIPEQLDEHDVTIGTPPAGVILDIDSEVTRGAAEEGELVISGRQVATGYLTRGEDPNGVGTIQRFDPASVGRSFRSGDRVRRHSDGSYTYLGRLSREVKVKGFRVNLAALESSLNSYPRVISAHVSVTDDELRAIVVTKDSTITADNLNSYLGKIYPKYSCPEKISITDELCTNERGKVNYGFDK